MSRCPFDPEFGPCSSNCELNDREIDACKMVEYFEDTNSIKWSLSNLAPARIDDVLKPFVEELKELNANLEDIAALISVR